MAEVGLLSFASVALQTAKAGFAALPHALQSKGAKLKLSSQVSSFMAREAFDCPTGKQLAFNWLVLFALWFGYWENECTAHKFTIGF
jgi:hypothetical protein